MKIILVEWLDASRVESYYIPSPTQSLGLENSYSVGIVIEDTPNILSLGQTIHGNQWYRDIITIPKKAISKIAILKEDTEE